MVDSSISKIQNWINNQHSELLRDTQQLLRYPTVRGEAAPNAPFGKTLREALDFMLDMGKKWGMKTKDLDGYAGYIEIGEGENLIVALGHIDVVPEGEGWSHDPFGAEISDGYLYARGTIDDKGPTMASLYAMRAIQQTAEKLNARIRLVIGCNEESGFECVKYYVDHEEAPTYGIAPDSDWPVIHGEKGISIFEITAPLPQGLLTVQEISGGAAANVVMEKCHAKLKVDPSIKTEIEEKVSKAWDKNLTLKWDNDILEIFSQGKAAHGSTPFEGDSAATRLLRFLIEIAPIEQRKEFFDLFMLTNPNGAGLGIVKSDGVSQDLTCNTGVITSDGKGINIKSNVRYPVTWNGEEMHQQAKNYLAENCPQIQIKNFNDSSPLYIPADHPMVQTIVDVYEQESGQRLKPKVMGGGTYARAIPNTVSVGTGWEGDGEIHSFDEKVKVEHLTKMSRIYAHILYKLSQL